MEVSQRDPGVEANARLTGYTGTILLVGLAIVSITGLTAARLLDLHVLVGFFLIPPLLLKLGAVGYRFFRYYTREPRYRAAGPPTLGMRLLAPILVFLTIVVFASGIELWFFGFQYGFFWLPLHHGSAYLWFVAIAIHVVNYLPRAPDLASADVRDHLRGAFTRRSVVLASLLLGVALAIAMLSFHSAFVFRTGE